MTGEYCAQQTNIQKERQKLHDKGEINAFVVMNFSSISDVVYESRIAPFIKQLNQYLYLDNRSNRIACVSSSSLSDLNDYNPISFSDIKDAIIESARRDSLQFRQKLKAYIAKKPANEKDYSGNKKVYFGDIDIIFPDFKELYTQHPLMNSEKQQLGDYLHTLDKAGELGKLFDSFAWRNKAEYYQSFLWKNVSKIHVHRADSNPVSNYIICNRICQQMQTADLIVVDVSVESANVFYEFGLATAFHKLILPICFSESFYEMKLPPKLEDAILAIQHKQLKTQTKDFIKKAEALEEDPPLKDLEKHIDCYPWRRVLFEHFGIRHQRNIHNDQIPYNSVRYLNSNVVFSEKYGFTDYQYNHFPYNAKKDKKATSASPAPTVGQTIYDWLQRSYNKASAHNYNSVIVYTMDRILDKNQAGHCIVNFYYNITKPMLDKHCFCGDRVAILGQPNRIIEDPKDSKTDRKLLYGVSDLIRIGMDEATYEAERRCIKTSDYMTHSVFEELTKQWMDAAEQAIKTHIRNRCILLNPETPIYVTQYQDGIQHNLDDVEQKIITADKPDQHDYRFFCLYHVMLDTLRYTNEVVVDLSSNSVQSMFWLGAAHGSNIYTITVRHEISDKEKIWSGIETVQKDRPIFDIGGLWTAMLRYDETENFYHQLALIQQGIEQNTKLMLPETDLESIEADVSKQLYSPTHNLHQYLSPNYDDAEKDFYYLLRQKNRSESFALESYYRDCFWRHMLRDNQLHLFLPMSDSEDFEGPRLHLIKWDVDAIAELSHYLSKRKIIGKYQFDTLRKNEFYGCDDQSGQTRAAKENFISIGNQTKPLQGSDKKALSLAEYINEYCTTLHPVRYMYKQLQIMAKTRTNELFPVQDRGFAFNNESPVHAQFFTPTCTNCLAYQVNCYDPTQTTHDKSDETLSFPDTIKLIWNPVIAENGKVESHFTVQEPINSSFLSNFHFRFLESSDHSIVATVQCSAYSHNEVLSSKLNDTFGFFFNSGLTLIKSSSDSNKFSGNYKVSCSCDVPEKLILTILSKYGLQMGNNAATLCEVNYSCNTAGITSIPSFTMPAQLVLWREPQNIVAHQQDMKDHADTEDTNHDYKYHVSLVGVSGPATKALTSLLVDKDQKKRILNSTSDNLHQYLPLNSLQTHLRTKFSEEFCKRLETTLAQITTTGNDGSSGESSDNSLAFTSDEIAKVLFLTETYLSTVLYQYFLPFLSQADEKRIYHALEAFLLTLDSKDDHDFEVLVSGKVSKILTPLKEVLADFRGVEAIYKVHVTVDTSTNQTDNRKIIGIEQWCDENNDPVITCLFADKPSKIGE